MATVCVCVQDSQKCLVPWTIFQTDDGITLSELLERMKAGRITVIVPSSDLVSSTIEKAFVGKSKESLVSIDHCIHLSDILSTFGQFIRYNGDPVCMDHSWTTVVHGDPVEKLYYSAGYNPICYYYASEEVCEVPQDVYPLCSDCISKAHVKKRKTV